MSRLKKQENSWKKWYKSIKKEQKNKYKVKSNFKVKKHRKRIKQSKDIEVILNEFWLNAGYCKDKCEKIVLLKTYNDRLVNYITSRQLLDARREYDRLKFGYFTENQCFVCLEAPDIGHHIVMLKNGGTNQKRNIVLLCKNCHEKIHPWLRYEKN